MRSFGKTTTRMLALLACALTMAACAPAEPHATPTPTQTAIFASEDEALDAAVAVYKKFNAAIDEVSNEGTEGLTALEPFVTEDFYEIYKTDQSDADDGEHTSGHSSFSNAEILSLEQNDDKATVIIGLCRDVSELRILDSRNRDITDETRKISIVPMKLTFTWSSHKSMLIVSDFGPWQDSSSC